MFRVCDEDRNHGIDFSEFLSLWRRLLHFQKIFYNLDSSGLGGLSFDRYYEGLQEMGFSLSRSFFEYYFWKHIPGNIIQQHSRSYTAPVMSFDSFVQSCLNLQRMTLIFKSLDSSMTGRISMPYNQFLEGISSLI